MHRYHGADVFVLPSFGEGMPNVVLEAMSCGLPVVATAVAGSAELVRDGVNGLLIYPADVPALSQALGRLVGDASMRKSMGKQSRLLAQSYDWALVAERYDNLSKQVLAGGQV